MIYIITDTHFNHQEMITKFKKRPDNFENKIWKSLSLLNEDDILLHLWDFCIWNDQEVAKRFKNTVRCTSILIKWNHDKKSDNWYRTKAWFTFILEGFLWKYFWKEIYFSHIPNKEKVWDINIHWHTHWNKFSNENKKNNNYLKYYSEDFRYNLDYHKEFALEND